MQPALFTAIKLMILQYEKPISIFTSQETCITILALGQSEPHLHAKFPYKKIDQQAMSFTSSAVYSDFQFWIYLRFYVRRCTKG